jgi:ribulose-5-phosphate 4-epimerase/fuculose-1-phosphate aldolase
MASTSEIASLKERVATACRILARLDLTREPAGHVSARIPGTERILIKARGPGESGVRFTRPEDIVEVDMSGKMQDSISGFVSPREVFIHTWMYRTRPEVNSVIHIHPPTVVTFTIVGKPLLPIYGAYDPGSLRLLLKGVPLYDKSVLISNDTLGEELAQTMADKDVVLMRGHGITSVGTDVETAGLNAIAINEVAEMNYKAYMLGDPRPISDEDLKSFETMGRGAPRTEAAPAADRVPGGPAWETYRRWVDD